MTNPYYAHSSGVPATLTRAASSQIRNEYDLIEDGFDLIDAAIDAKANIDSPTFTGTVTVPTPLTASAAATKAYVDALSVAAGDVPTGGSTGQYLVKDSATDFDKSWGSIVSVGTGGTTSTASITLTASSAAAMTVTPATPGLYVTLPDATTCTKADNLYSVYNAGDYDYGVKDSAGTQLGWIRARTGAMIGLADNATAAGVWAYYGLEKTGITASYVNSTLTNMGSTIRRIALDANRTCFLFGGVDCYAIVYDASTQTWGSATLVRATVANGAFVGVLSATDQVLVFSCPASTAGQAVTLSISGTTVTVNTPVAVTMTYSNTAFVKLVAVPAQSAFVLTYTATAAGIRAITVSGTVPTVSSETSIASADTLGDTYVSGSVVRVPNSASASFIRVTPFTISGSSAPALGTNAQVNQTGSGFRAFLNGNGNIVCHYINGTHYATIFKLTGTTEAASSVSLGTAPTNITTQSDYVQVTASKTAFLYSASSTTWYANILTDTAGTASAGTEISSSVQNSMAALAGLSANGNIARFAIFNTNQTGQVSLDCSGSSATISTLYYIGNDTTVSQATTAASNSYGARSANLVKSGQCSILLANGRQIASMQYLPGSVKRLPASAFSFISAVQGISSTTESESFVAGSTSNSTSGFFIQRVEAAA